MPSGFHRVDMAKHLFDLGPALDLQQDVAAGRTKGSVWGSPGSTARTMSMREMIVPKSLAAQRTKAKTLPGRKEDAAAAVEHLFVRFAAEPDPVLDPLLDPGQLDMGEAVGGARRHGAAARAEPRCRS
jgi:hypothetical protein